MDKLCHARAGKGIIRAFHSMYEKTAYIPKVSNSQLGERITTEHGVTQGKESSANLCLFYVSDMPTYMEQFTTDYMDPLNLVQLADDTATLASYLASLILKIKSLFGYSEDNYQVANVGKTKYLHLSKNPFTEPLQIDEGQFVESAHDKGYVYLGSLFISSNILTEHITANLIIEWEICTNFMPGYSLILPHLSKLNCWCYTTVSLQRYYMQRKLGEMLLQFVEKYCVLRDRL